MLRMLEFRKEMFLSWELFIIVERKPPVSEFVVFIEMKDVGALVDAQKNCENLRVRLQDIVSAM